MLEMSSPVLIIGDPYLSKNIVISAKKKYKNAHWEIVSASEQSPDEIRMLAGFNSFGSSDKIVLIQDIPNRKQVREFLIDLVKSSSNSLKFIIWDSLNHIKVDPKTREISKTWNEFVQTIRNMKDAKIVDSGSDFTDKENMDCVKFVHDCFKKFGKRINDRAAILFVDIVGRNRGLILSEVQKLSLNCPEEVLPEFVLENAFPTSSEAALYKFGNSLDSGNIATAINSFEEFMSHGVSTYILTEIMVKKARWQLAVAHLWMNNIQWMDMPDILMDMGKFPSIIWHDGGLSTAQKKRLTEDYDNLASKIRFMSLKMGIPEDCFIFEVKEKKSKKEDDEEDSKPKARAAGGECLPLKFIAQQIVDSVRSKIVEPNKDKYSGDELKNKVFTRCLLTYLNVLDLMKDIRYEQDDSVTSIYEMMKLLTDSSVDSLDPIE